MEKLYQYLWKNKLLGKSFNLNDSRPIEIINPGVLNNNAGPDFLNARIRIEGKEWFGNIEIHVKASDWFLHNHHNDPAYDSVLLHVVAINDHTITRKNGDVIPQLTASFPQEFFNLYSALSNEIASVRCAHNLKNFSHLHREDFLESLAVERIQSKAQRILDILQNLGGDWQQTCFVSLARALGFNLNGDPFEILARSLPLNILHRHSDSLLQLEAILFGQAGMLDMSQHIFDEYYQSLCREYYFLARKYNLKPMRREIWKYARTRPANFPHRRIALLAKILLGGFSLLSDILESNGDPAKITEIFNWKAEGYWLSHIDFDREQPMTPTFLGDSSINLLMINFIAPIIYARAASYGDYEMAEKGLDLWNALPPESNTFIREWKKLGFDCHCAARSQALLQLRKEYCDKNRCLDCRFALKLFASTISQ